jgi:hypothetical protein
VIISNTAPNPDGVQAHQHGTYPARAALVAAARAEWFRSIAIVAALAGLLAADPYLAILLSPVLVAHGGRAITLARPGVAGLSVVIPAALAGLAAYGSGGIRSSLTAAILVGGLAGIVGIIATRSLRDRRGEKESSVRIAPAIAASALVFGVACLLGVVLHPVDSGVLLRRDVVQPQFDTLAQSCKQAESDGKNVSSCEALAWEAPIATSITRFPERYLISIVVLSAMFAGWYGLRLRRRFGAGENTRRFYLAEMDAFDRGEQASGRTPEALPNIRLDVPWWVAYVGVVSLIVVYLGAQTSALSVAERAAVGIAWGALCATAVAYWAQGVCVVASVFVRLRFGRPLRLLGWVMIMVTPMGIGGVFALGLIDGVINLRREPPDQDTISGREGPTGP